MPRVRRVRPPRGQRDLLPAVRLRTAGAWLGGRRRRRDGGTIGRAGRVTAGASASEESPDTTGQDAGEIPGGESRRKVAQKGNRLRRISGGAGGKGETVG